MGFAIVLFFYDNMKIAFDYQIFMFQKYGGISRYFCELLTWLPRVAEDVEPIAIAPLHINAYLSAVQRRVYGKRICSFRGKHHFLPFINACISKKILLALRPDICHQTYYFSPGRLQNMPYVLSVYDMIHELYPDEFQGADCGIADKKKASVQNVDHVITISHATRKDLQRILATPEEKISVIYLASTLRPSSVRGISLNRPFLLYVGLRQGVKNFSNFIHAYATSQDLKSSHDVVCVGGGPFNREEKSVLEGLCIAGKVRQIDADDTLLGSIYNAAALLVYPSLYEGFGLPLLEAMRCECPIVCSRSSSFPEIAGDAAVFFDPFDISDMRIKMETTVYDRQRCQELVNRGNVREKLFTWEECAMKTLEVYKEILHCG